jgi:hypothetical protein
LRFGSRFDSYDAGVLPSRPSADGRSFSHVSAGGSGEQLQVAESLAPPTSLFAATRLFLAGCALPPLLASFNDHRKGVSGLLQAAKPVEEDEDVSVTAE